MKYLICEQQDTLRSDKINQHEIWQSVMFTELSAGSCLSGYPDDRNCQSSKVENEIVIYVLCATAACFCFKDIRVWALFPNTVAT